MKKDDPGAFIFPIRLEGQVNENALADTGSDINTMPYQIYEQLEREEMKKVDRGIIMINHTQAEAMGILTNVLCQVGVTTLIAKFLILDIPINRDALIVVGRGFLRTISGIVRTPESLFSTFDGFCHQTFRAARSDIMRNTESDSDDEEEYEIKRNKFGAPIYGLKPAPYLNCKDPTERSLAIQIVNNPFRKISVWKKATTRGNDVEAESSRSKCSRQFETIEEVLLTQVDHDFLLWEGCNNEAKSRYNTKLVSLLPRHVYSSGVVNWDVLNGIGCDGEIDDMLRIKLHEAKSNEEIFTFVAWIRAFNIKEPICVELCYEFYSTYEFDEVYADDELQSKKIIKFRLGERAHNLALLETTRYDKIQKNDLWLLSMFDARHQNGYANVAWLIARWMKRKSRLPVCQVWYSIDTSEKHRMHGLVMIGWAVGDSLGGVCGMVDWLDVLLVKEVILFYNGLDVPTRQILDSKGVIPSKTVADAKIAIQEMANYSQKWHNGTSRTKSTKTSDGLAAIQAQLHNLGREIKKVNEKVYAAQVGCEQCKGPHYTKDFPLKEEGKTLEEAYYTQFGRPFQ
ncbi:retrotransposon ORF1 [Tanacetum coccineum]